MTLLLLIPLGVLLAGASAWRWAYVSQREHYIPGAAGRIALRWLRARPLEGVVLAVALAIALAGAVTASRGTGQVLLVIGTALTALVPLGMPLARARDLRTTRRARTQLAVTAALLAVAAALVGVLAGPVALLVASAPAVVLATDAAARLLQPHERRQAQGFVDTAKARLAALQPQIVAVTGSYGKTSTKGHIADLVGADIPTVASPASWNNTAGLSRTINEKVPDGTRLLVLEMGTYGPGEIREMCAWATPEIAVITEVGPMHLERMGTVERISEAKQEILERARVGVLWVDNPHLATAADRWRDRIDVVAVGTGPDADVRVAATADGIEVHDGEGLVGTVTAAGLHAGNIGCAVAVALRLGIDRAAIGTRLAQLTSPPHRTRVETAASGATVIDDTFNANPPGAAAAIELLQRTVPGRRVVATPGFIELGSEEAAANRALAEQVVASGAELLVIGHANRRALTAGAPGARTFADRPAAVAWARSALGQGDGIAWINDLPGHYP